jgi:hypothetical protein
MRKASFAAKMEEKEEGVILLGLSPQGLFRKEYLVKISLLLLVEKPIAFLNQYPLLGQHRRVFSYSQDKYRERIPLQNAPG